MSMLLNTDVKKRKLLVHFSFEGRRLFNTVFPKLFQTDSVRCPLGFQLDSQHPLAFLSEKNVRQRIFICNFAVFLPNFW